MQQETPPKSDDVLMVKDDEPPIHNAQHVDESYLSIGA